MPLYTLKNKKTGEVEDVFVSISEMQRLTDEETGEYTQIIGAPMLVTHTGSILGKTSDGWKDRLKEIKKGSGRGNTINN